jgi:hypothetical protein
MACVSYSAPGPAVPDPEETPSLEAYQESIPGTLHGPGFTAEDIPIISVLSVVKVTPAAPEFHREDTETAEGLSVTSS